MEKAGDILKKYFKENFFLNKNLSFDIFSGWESIVGKKFNGHSRVVDIKQNVLLIEVDHPGWFQMITMKETEILKKINEKYPELEIKSLKFNIKYKYKEIYKKNKIKFNKNNYENCKIPDIKYEELKNSLNRLYNSVLNNIERRVDKNE